ncbi:MAG: hypothetical protein PHY09_14545 [Desulfuromonadaceae bacterium]|nr:hypothetical protein [Desulfuromonadaceae bacterium]MDD5107040.1 hypothetical protein [Desulfuromonadaceae bacterium]
MAEDVNGQIAVIYSPHKTELSAPGYLAGAGELPKDHENDGSNYWGLMGEVNYGKVSLSVDYLRGKSKKVSGGANFADPYTFNPLTYENSDTFDLTLGYNVIDNAIMGKTDITLGYFRMWASPTISPPNWYDGPEIGIKGRRTWDGGNALIYKVGYVPAVEVHGYMKDDNLMKGKNIINVKVGGEFPIFESISAVGGYMWTRAENVVVANEQNGGALYQYGDSAVVKFSGFYFGAMYHF